MGVSGKTSKKGVGEKEADGTVRDTPLYCKLPKNKLNLTRLIAKNKKITVTDAVSEAMNDWIDKNAEYITPAEGVTPCNQANSITSEI